MTQRVMIISLLICVLAFPLIPVSAQQPPGSFDAPAGVRSKACSIDSDNLPERVYLPLVTLTAPPPSDSKAWKTYLTVQEQYIADRINEIRVENGLHPLEVNAHLNTAAYRHSSDLADNSLTGHIGSDGSTAGDRIYETGYEWST